VSAPILRRAPAPSKTAPELVKCPTCEYGHCAPGTSCTACVDAHHRSQEARTRAQGRELIARLAHLIECRPTNLKAALLAELAEGIVEIVGAVLDARGTP
jgi:hypothetical protein